MRYHTVKLLFQKKKKVPPNPKCWWYKKKKKHVSSQDFSSQLQIPISISPKPKPDIASGILSSCLHSPHKSNQSVGSSVVLVCFPLPAPISSALVQVRLLNPTNIYWLLRVPSTGLGTVNMKMNKIWFLSQKSLKFSTETRI